MTFISYSQNYEDVILHRALKHVDKGFYIDVGANDPVIDSVTKAFYTAGWRGINIEPVSEWYEKLQQDRPEDINLQLAVGERKGNFNFYEVVGTGLSTMDEQTAKRHAREHGFELRKYKVPVVRLTSICEEHPYADIHFLKIDVEGAELATLQSLDLTKIRPWIVLVESTLPNSQIENYVEWQYSLTDRGYHFVYFDGLNRYYVADEHHELDAAFQLPPNYFDYFKRASEDLLERRAQWLENEWNLSKANLNQLESSASQVESTLQHTEQQRQDFEIQLLALQAEAAQREERLREKESKQQELLLALVEKETRLQETSGTLRERKQQIKKQQVDLAAGKEQQQQLEFTLQETEKQRRELDDQLRTVQKEADQRDETLREKESKQQELLLAQILLAQIEKETKLLEITATLNDSKRQVAKLHTSLTKSEEQVRTLVGALQGTEQQRQQFETLSQNLQTDALIRDASLRENEKTIDWLNNEWEAAKLQIEELCQSNHQWWSVADQQVRELENTRVQIEELSQSSHHWRLESERLNRELMSVYGSKSWRLTWPLRKLFQFLKWIFYLPIRMILWALRLPERAVRWLLVKAMAFALNRSGLKARAEIRFRRYPRLDAKLRRFAAARGLIAGGRYSSPSPAPAAPESNIPESVVTGVVGSEAGVDLLNMTPRARRIYSELKRSMEKQEQERN